MKRILLACCVDRTEQWPLQQRIIASAHRAGLHDLGRCLQAWMPRTLPTPGRDGFHAGLADIPNLVTKSLAREWTATGWDALYLNYEPHWLDGPIMRSWQGGLREQITDADILFGLESASLARRTLNGAGLHDTRHAIYGTPPLPRDRGWTDDDAEYLERAGRMHAGYGLALLQMYPGVRDLTPLDAARRAEQSVEVFRRRTGLEPVPMLWARPDAHALNAAQLEGLGEAETLVLWSYQRTDAEAAVTVRALEQLAGPLNQWRGV